MLHALLIGINTYKNAEIPTLSACLNDVLQMQQFLSEYTALTPVFYVYKNDAATRSAIIAILQKIAADLKTGDTFVFYFSGHGAEEKTDISFFGDTIEGFVCHDSLFANNIPLVGISKSDIPLLANKEFRFLLQPIAAKAAHTLVITDCCHSGEITRYSTARKIAQIQPARAWQNFVFAATLSQNDAAKMPIARHIHIAACEPDRLAYEEKGSGVLTQNLLKTVREAKGKISYQRLKERLLLSGNLTMQRPAIEALNAENINLNFLTNEALTQVNQTILQYNISRKIWLLGTGAQQNILSQTTLKTTVFLVYKNDILQPFYIKILAIEDTTTTIENNEFLDKNAVYTVVINDSYAPLYVSISGADDAALKKVQLSYENYKKTDIYNIKLVEKAIATYNIVLNGKSFSPAAQIFDIKNTALNEPVFDPPLLWSYLVLIQKWLRIRDFQNGNTAWTADKLPLKIDVFCINNNTETPLSRKENGIFIIKENTKIGIRLTNTDGRKLYIGGAFLSAQFGMTKLLSPQSSLNEMGKSVDILSGNANILTVAAHRKVAKLEGEMCIYKLIFSTKIIDISTWQQAEIPPPMIKKQTMRSETKGFDMDSFDLPPSDDWACLNIVFWVEGV